MLIKKIIVIFTVSVLGFISQITYANTDININDTNNYHYYKLDNGLQIIIKEDHRAPIATNMVWYKVGSIDESPYKTGLSHILEHLMFKGTKKYPEFSKVMASFGAKENAFTNSSYTVYHQELPSEHLKQAIFMEADRMRNLNINSKEFIEKFNKEIKIIQEERRLRTDNNPHGKLYEQLMANAYIVNGIRIPTIGWMDDIQNTTYLDAKNWYDKYYYPNNATVVIVGDVNHKQVYKWIKQAYQNYKPNLNIKNIDKVNINKIEPEQYGKKNIEIYSKQVEDASLYMLYKTPNFHEKPKHVLSLVLLSTILTGYDYAYLDKKLVKQDKLLSSINVDQDLMQRALFNFTIVAKPRNSTDISKIANIIQNSIINLNKDISEIDLNRAKKQWIANNIYKKDSILNAAMELGVAYSNGYDYNFFDKIQDDINKLTLNDIKEVVNLYFNDKNLTIGILLPETK